jgi:2-amino-4-hydroxy-6-hydroxymethyldihydropteridine diphosphokinase
MGFPLASDAGQAGELCAAEVHEAAIGLGSNQGQSCTILQAAWQDLQEHPDISPLAFSSPYRSQPFGLDSANWFVNAAALVRTRLRPHSLLHLLQSIEKRYGRVRNYNVHGYQDRTLDLDLLLYDDLILHADHLVIPHPRMEHRLFVLAPLAEIAGDRCHPLSQKKISLLFAGLERNAEHQIVEKCCWAPSLPIFVAKR